MSKKTAVPLFFAAVFLVEFCVFALIGLERPIARDEGFYSVAAKLVSLGYTPYFDFFYPQPPYLPYFYAAWISIVDLSWVALRLSTALLATGTGLLLARYIFRHYGTAWAFFGSLLYVSSDFILCWFSVSKAYSLTSFLLLISLYIFESKDLRSSTRTFLTGAFLGLAVGCRIIVVALVPVYLIYEFVTAEKDKRWNNTSLIVIGTCLLLLPLVILFLTDTEVVWFNLFGYHLFRSSVTFEEAIANRFDVLLSLLRFDTSGRFYGPQFAILSLCTFGYLILRSWQDKRGLLAGLTALTLAAVHFYPSPTYVQYFVLLVPFLIIATISLLSSLPLSNRRLPIACLVVFIAYAWSIPTAWQHYSGKSKKASTNSKLVTISELSEIGATLKEKYPDEVYALSPWPGYLFESHLLPYPATENHFGTRIAKKLSREQNKALKIITLEKIKKLISEKKVKVVVLGKNAYKREFKKILGTAGYTRDHESEKTVIYSN